MARRFFAYAKTKMLNWLENAFTLDGGNSPYQRRPRRVATILPFRKG